jgi:hypothetical protein
VIISALSFEDHPLKLKTAGLFLTPIKPFTVKPYHLAEVGSWFHSIFLICKKQVFGKEVLHAVHPFIDRYP